MESLSRLALSNTDDPHEFNLAVASLLVGLGADKYVDIFRKNNIGQKTLIELNDEDLMKLGVDDAVIREKIVEEVKSLPLYEEIALERNLLDSDGLDPIEVGGILTDTSQHLHRIYLSLMSNRLALRKTKKIQDCLVYRDSYASDVAINTLNGLNQTLDSIEKALQDNLKVKAGRKNTGRKKVLVGSAGGALAVVLAVLLFQSLKRL